MPPRHIPALIPPPEDIVVTTGRVACDGGGGALGHPLVYLDLGQDGVAECGYCDRRFVLTGHTDIAYSNPAARPPEAH